MGSLIDFQGYTSIGTIMTNAALLILDGTTMHRVLAWHPRETKRHWLESNHDLYVFAAELRGWPAHSVKRRLPLHHWPVSYTQPD